MASSGKEGGLNQFRPVRRRTVRLTQEELVTKSLLDTGEDIPLVLQPNAEDLNLAVWAGDNRELIQTELVKYGAILLRGFNVKSREEFLRFVKAASGDPLEYSERSSPRSHVGGNIYTSTDYPPDRSIFPHNEQSYNLTFPLKIIFFCLTPAQQGGETPIVSCRKVLQRISPEIRERFSEKKYMYVRNFGDSFGLSWQTAFQTTSETAVERYCRENDIHFEWKAGNRLKTWQVREPMVEHPLTGELVWFNHLVFFNVSTLEPDVREALLERFSEEDLPNNTYYGDGSPIEPSVLEELIKAYRQEMICFPWQAGDVLMLDNLLTSHARKPYAGPRKVLVAMAEPIDRRAS